MPIHYHYYFRECSIHSRKFPLRSFCHRFEWRLFNNKVLTQYYTSLVGGSKADECLSYLGCPKLVFFIFKHLNLILQAGCCRCCCDVLTGNSYFRHPTPSPDIESICLSISKWHYGIHCARLTTYLMRWFNRTGCEEEKKSAFVDDGADVISRMFFFQTIVKTKAHEHWHNCSRDGRETLKKPTNSTL